MPSASPIKIPNREVKLYGGANGTFLQYREKKNVTIPVGEADGSGILQEFFESYNRNFVGIPVRKA